MDPTVIPALEAMQELKVAELKKRYRELFDSFDSDCPEV
jgi:hypothetical protein